MDAGTESGTSRGGDGNMQHTEAQTCIHVQKAQKGPGERPPTERVCWSPGVTAGACDMEMEEQSWVLCRVAHATRCCPTPIAGTGHKDVRSGRAVGVDLAVPRTAPSQPGHDPV